MAVCAQDENAGEAVKKSAKSAKSATPACARGHKPAKRHLKRLRPGQPADSYKLCDALREEVCRLIRLGNSREDSARLAGIHRDTMRVWRERGAEEAAGPYRQFLEEVELAEIEWKSKALQRLQTDRDAKWTWLLLKARYPHEFREKTELELAGPNGMPITPNPFKVEVICDCPPDFWEQFVAPDQREAVFGEKQAGDATK
jgi:hypothetical protein